MSIEAYIAYFIACVAVIAVPGPTVTVIIANSLRYGARAGLANVGGTQLGLAFFLVVMIAGLSSIMAFFGDWFNVLRLVGAAYLTWLGIRLWLSDSKLTMAKANKPKGGFFLQGLIVVLSNPKVLLFFGAFVPQFINPEVNPVLQLILLGLTFMAVAAVIDGAYAFLSGGAGAWLSHKRVRLLERLSGTFLVGGGLWLAFSRN